MTIEEKFEKTYSPLIRKFIQEVEYLNCDNLPEPHLPVYGTEYENNPYKIAFVGWETRDGTKLKKYISDYKESGVQKVLKWWDEDFNEEEGFVFAQKYHNHTGNDFWGFIFKFLNNFYNKGNWKDIENRNYPEILKSFIWGNMESIERFEVANRGQNASIEDYKKVKKASLILDSASHLINTFQPNIIIVLRWREDDAWLTGNFACSPVKLADHLDYYFVENTNTHVFWTAHPGWLARNKRIDETIISILEAIQQKQIFTSFPGEAFLDLKKKRGKLISKLKNQLEEKSLEIKFQVSDEDWGTGGESYFYFDLPNSKRGTSICFGFDSGYKDFSIGIWVKDKLDGYDNFKTKISSLLTPIIGEDKNFTNWPYLHYFDNDLKNWEINSQVWEDIESGILSNTLVEKVKEIKKGLEGFDF